ncbi:MAG: bifunctional nuclease family protein [Thermodesulfobacteriota bacterium]
MIHRLLLVAAAFVLVHALVSADVLRGEEKGSYEYEEMVIKGVGFDKITGTPVVLLTDKKQGGDMLPIWIGLCEARAIELGISDSVAPRPMTYDLVAAIVRTLNAKVKRVLIVDLRDNVFYAQVEVSIDGKTQSIDARPSDALALALRMGAPVFVNKAVIKKSLLRKDPEKKREI